MSSDIHLLQANIGMGLDHQKSLSQGLQSMGAYFLACDPEFFRKNAEVQSYIEYIRKENPDILYLTEVCGVEQRDMIVEGLEKLGYRTHVIPGFELWNMEQESHRYLYHIMGTKSEFQYRNSFYQYTENPLQRYIQLRNMLGKEGNNNTSEKVESILDGGGSRYVIDGIEVGLLHAHANTSTRVFEGLLSSLHQSGNNHQMLVGDVNMNLHSADRIAKKLNPDMQRIETKNTYPYYFSDASKPGIFTNAINSLMKKHFLSHPDQAYINPGVELISQKTLGAKETGLKTDHAVSHYQIRSTSQSSPQKSLT